MFSEIDVDGDESMSLDEFIVNRHLLGLKTLNLEEATALFHEIDDDHSGNVSYGRERASARECVAVSVC